MFEVTLEKRGRGWWWRVQDRAEKAIMAGGEKSRSEAKYQGERALFLLLITGAIGPSQVLPQFVRGNRGFLASGASLIWSLLAVGPAFAGLSPRRKSPFPAQVETGSMTGW